MAKHVWGRHSGVEELHCIKCKIAIDQRVVTFPAVRDSECVAGATCICVTTLHESTDCPVHGTAAKGECNCEKYVYSYNDKQDGRLTYAYKNCPKHGCYGISEMELGLREYDAAVKADKATPPGLPEKQRIYQHVPPSLFSQLREVRRTCNALIDYLTRAHRPLVGRVPHLNSHRDQRQMNVDIDTLTLAVRELQRRIGGKDDE